jgi:hypothetical protein
MGTHIQLMHHGHFGTAWRIWLAEVAIVVLGCFGLFFTVSSFLQGEFELGLMALGCLTGSAIIYAFGYLRCLPDVLGGINRDDTRDLKQRWLDFALLTTFIAILVIVCAYIRAIWENRSYISVAGAVALVVACCWVLPACVVASDKYLSWTMANSEIRSSSGWRARVRQATATWGNWLVKLGGKKPVLAAGGALALLSLFLSLGDVWLTNSAGYKVVAGRSNWPIPTLGEVPNLGVIMIQVLRGVYLLGLVVAAVALLGLVPGKLARIIQNSRILAILAAAIALLHISNATLAFDENKSQFVLWILIWALPITLWLRGARGGGENWDRIRIALMVFYLPIFLIGIALMVTFTYLTPGFGSFVVGMLLVWWGLVQCRHEIAQPQDPNAA